MKTIVLVLWAVFFLVAPALVILLCRRFRAVARIGAILMLYFIGLLFGNLLIYPFEGAADMVFPLQDALTSITVPLAIPLILFACSFKDWPVKKSFTSLIIGLISVCAVSVAGFFLFRSHLGDEAAPIAGMITGVYTGGTPNLAAIKMMLGVDEGTYLIVNSLDMLVSFLYLVFLMAAGIKLARKFLPFGTSETGGGSASSVMAMDESQMYRDVFSRENRGGTLAAIGLAVLIAAAGLGMSFLITGGINMLVLILTLTTLAIAASFIPAVRRWSKSYDVGMYLVLVFSLVVASMVDIRSLDLAGGFWLMCYIAFAIFGSLTLQLLFSRLFRVDADTAVISSVAMINSPLFVPMIAGAMKNKRVIISGISIGIIGYAAGNYLGVLIAGLLR